MLSTFDFMSSTPTLFNSGTHRSQLVVLPDHRIRRPRPESTKAIKENALLSSSPGPRQRLDQRARDGLAHQRHQRQEPGRGAVPQVVNDTAVAVNQGGKRKGAVCTYLETWHLDIEEFLELRKNTGDDCDARTT